MNPLNSKSSNIIKPEHLPSQKTRESFGIFCEKVREYYSERKHRFENKSVLPEMDRDARIRMIKVMIERIETIPIKKETLGYTIVPGSQHVGLLTLTTHGFSTSQLRGKGRGMGLFSDDFTDISRWNPLVLSVLATKHNLAYEDFWINGNSLARVMLGRELKDLTVPVNESVLIKLSDRYTYYINEEGEKDTRNNLDNRIIRFRSPIFNVYYDDYPGTYKPGLSKNQMKEIVNYHVRTEK